MMYTYKGEILRVVDGDTLDFVIDLGFRVYTNIRVRLLGINAPERHTEKGREVTQYLSNLLPVGTELTVTTYKDPTDKYGRWLAIVSSPDETVASLNDLLVKLNYAEVI